MKIFAAEDLHVPPFAAAGDRAVAYVRDCIAPNGTAAIRNVRTHMHLLDTGAHRFPVSVNSGERHAGLSYVVSPLSAYGGYAGSELERLKRPWLAWPLLRFVRASETVLNAARIDRLVQVNNWLLSTNLYPPQWFGEDLRDVTALVAERFPDHAFGFRSLNGFTNAEAIARFRRLGYVAIPSRQVYIFDARAGRRAPCLTRHNSKIDGALLGKTRYEVVAGADVADEEFERLERLYNLLYIEKYSALNPQFTAEWLRRGRRDGWLELRALRAPEGRIDGVLGWFANEAVITAPIVGYDTGLPQRAGLYRLLTRLCIEEAVERRIVLNFSSGAAEFKRLRGGEPAIEYSFVYVRHLSKQRRAAWRALQLGLEAIAVPMLRGLKL